MKKKRILILGGSSDIGISLIEELLKEKNLEIYAHCHSKINNLKNLKKKNIKIFKNDFSIIDDQNFKNKLKKIFNLRFDYFVNLTGYISKSNFLNFKIGDQIKTLKVNVIIPNLIISKIIRKMLNNKFGRIVNCSSIGVKFGGGSNTYNYSLSKFTSEFIPYNFKEWAKRNVLINNLRIGVTNTKLHKKIGKNIKLRTKLIPINRAAETIEVVKFIKFLLSKDNSYTTGQTISISGGE